MNSLPEPRSSSVLAVVASAAAAIVAIVLWQFAELRREDAQLREDHDRLGEAILRATGSEVLRESRGARADLYSLRAALEETREVFDLHGIELRDPQGQLLARVGSGADGPADMRFATTFRPLQPRGFGIGPMRGMGADYVDLPPELALEISMAPEPLAARRGEARRHAMLIGTALSLVVLLIAGAFWRRARALALRADLQRSRAELQGLETLRRLGAGLAHETRNPLGVVRGFAERLAAGNIPAEQVAPTARAIVDETDRTVARLDEFLLLSRPAELRREPISVGDLFRELSMLLQPDLDAAGASLGLQCSGVEVNADRDQLRRLLLNLLLNATQAVQSGGHISLNCETAGAGRRRVVVEDDGPGVPDELRETLFEPYVTGRAQGTGLGLSIARRIAQDHGFTLHHQARSPRGTRMVLDLSQA